MIARHVIYRGRVQGVGFRYTTRDVAGGFAVAGFVRNLSDGSVELVAEGEADQVEAFLAAIEDRMVGYIKTATVQDATPQGMQGFSVRH